MQTLVNAIRATGAHNVIMLGGLTFADDMTRWLAYQPTDPDHDLVASWHSYNSNFCSNQYCWRTQISPVIARVPMIAGEIGEFHCTDVYLDQLMHYLDSKSTGYLAWSCDRQFSLRPAGPGLITNIAGHRTAVRRGIQVPTCDPSCRVPTHIGIRAKLVGELPGPPGFGAATGCRPGSQSGSLNLFALPWVVSPSLSYGGCRQPPRTCPRTGARATRVGPPLGKRDHSRWHERQTAKQGADLGVAAGGQRRSGTREL